MHGTNMHVWSQDSQFLARALDEPGSHGTENEDEEDTSIKDQEFELKSGGVQAIRNRTQKWYTRANVQALVTEEMEK